ncbi:MAG: hypothetical protein HY456_00290 [Parcubacteria group bacterium]|nr:hypothetical protein [Parcubacteria group bacterium]
MKFTARAQKENAADLMRQLGYKPLGYTPDGELNCVRPIYGDYPRFHIYLKEDKENLFFSLHLDQKKPSYAGSTAHGGDYDSDTVKDEAERITGFISSHGSRQ